jgi:hypothetical protein
MQIAMKRRLERLEGQMDPVIQHVLVTQQKGESNADMDMRLEQWKLGKSDTGINGTYEGGELFVAHVCYVASTGYRLA